MASRSGLGATVVRLRTAAGWTQRDLAARAGLSVGAVRDIEQGRTRSPRPSALAALGDALAVPVDQLTASRPDRARDRIAILGPLELTVDGLDVPLTASQALILGRLVVEPGRFVAAEELADLLWLDAVPDGWRGLVQSHVTRLRRVWAHADEPPVIDAVRQRYRLVLGGFDCDARLFLDDLAAAAAYAEPEAGHHGDPTSAMAALARGLGRWRGAVLQDMPDLEAGAAARRLVERQRQAVLRLADLALATGSLQSALQHAVPAAEREPLDEALAAAAIGLLSAGGRYAEAMRVFDRTRRGLRDELGLDPGRDLARAHAELLRRGGPDRTPQAARGRGPAQLPRRLADFVGRAEELAQLTATLGDPAGAGMCVVTGLGGMGKTALAVEACHRVRAAFGDGQLFVDLRGHSGAPMSVERATELLLVGLGHDRHSIPDDPVARGALLRSETSGRRLLLVLDNVPDGTDLSAVIPGDASCGVVITARERPDGTDGAVHLRLGALPRHESQALLRACVGELSADADPDSLRRVGELCDGLPLALRLGAGRATGHDGWSLRTLSERLAAGTDVLAYGQRAVSASFDVSYRGLTSEQARLARLFAVSALVDVGVPAAARLADLTVPEARAAIEQLVTRSVLTSPARDRYTLHDLMRRFLAERSGEQDTIDEVDASTRSLVEWLTHGADAATALVVPFRISRPDAGGPLAELSDRAAAERWFAAEATNLTAVLPTVVDHRPDLGWRLTDACGGLFRVQENAVGWIAAAETGLAAARSVDDTVGVIVMQDALARGHAMRAQPRVAIAHYAAALELAGDWPQIAVSLRTNLGISHAALDDRVAAIAELGRAHDEALIHDLPYFRAAAVNELGNLARTDGDLRRSERLFTEALEVNRALADEHGQIINRGNLAQIRALRGDLDGAAGAFRELERTAVVRSSPLLHAEYLVELGVTVLEQGYVREGAQFVGQGWAIAQEIDNDSLHALALLGRALASAASGDSHTAGFQLERARALARAVSDVETELAVMLAAAGLHLDADDADDADREATAALERARSVGHRVGQGRAWHLRARAARLRADPAAARAAEAAAADVLAGTGYGELGRGERTRQGRRLAGITAR